MKVSANGFLAALSLLFLAQPAAEASAQAPAKDRASVRTIVLDAGHGGKDPGTTYRQYREKDITLKVALLLGGMIEKNLPDVKVVYTRKTDVYVELARRGDIANKAGADLFLSIHVDAATSPSAAGCSTFVMSMSKVKANLDVAMRENDVVSFEEDYRVKYEGYEPGSTESFIIFSLMQHAYIDQSMTFAEIVQKHYRRNQTATDRGARQAPFLVLWKTAMPSVLTELGFLSNARDRAFLLSEAGQRKVARSLFNAFSEYKSRVEGRTKTVQLGGEQDDTVTERNTESVTERMQERTGTGSSSAADGSGKITFAVQVKISYERLDPNDRVFGPFRGKVIEKKIGKYYKYFVGESGSYRDVSATQQRVRRTVKDAFMVAFRDGKPIAMAEARRLAGQ
ncbi:N-acetylmuramoyl-L-alanine amidase family protein [Gallalistipes aquisgranensis]|uniref:N-acetylmuramoyl-L-alanine amidase family protein n=1 Tax=Gallalistipes aquisgranensis TaxID=2779358 RepID=UPI001CF8585F|nr:N-acetylmuramoyl-L-alanine amidase [Gallalistipes aquisgranensis]MBE5033780.1 N-acetylmuramoyl-L-alanine amidase [Gallalistipes aquisgranensis]